MNYPSVMDGHDDGSERKIRKTKEKLNGENAKLKADNKHYVGLTEAIMNLSKKTEALEFLVAEKDKQMKGMRKDMSMAIKREKEYLRELAKIARGQEGELMGDFISRVREISKHLLKKYNPNNISF
jgi:predicted  nucleic acid-binding Zn-ribbon protein